VKVGFTYDAKAKDQYLKRVWVFMFNNIELGFQEFRFDDLALFAQVSGLNSTLTPINF